MLTVLDANYTCCFFGVKYLLGHPRVFALFSSSDAKINVDKARRRSDQKKKAKEEKKATKRSPNYNHQLVRWNMESMEYEQARNLTLLFFFERLIDKNEPRTLHDLSCQFGAPGFTKEMRQIAGGSESGELSNESTVCLINSEKNVVQLDIECTHS